MRTNLVQGLIVLLAALGITAFCAWGISMELTPTLWAVRVGSLAAALGVGVALRRAYNRPEPIPDRLREIAGRYFEKDGFCFAPVVATDNGICRLRIFFHNRYARPATGRVKLLPGQRSFSLSRHPLPTIDVDVPAPGAAFGVVWVPFEVPPAYAGKSVAFEVAADVHYANGRGKLIRARNGIRVGAIRELSIVHQLLSAVVPLAFGFLGTSSAARATLKLPDDAISPQPLDPRGPRVEILSSPDAAGQPKPQPQCIAA